MFKSAVFLLGIVALAVNADQYYYDLEKWIGPAVDGIKVGAGNGMDFTPYLHEHLAKEIPEFKKLDKAIRDKIATHLKAEVQTILKQVQEIIDIVKNVALESSSNLQTAVSDLDKKEAIEAVRGYASAQMGNVENAITALRLTLGKVNEDGAQKEEGKGSHKAFRKLSENLAEDVLKGVDAKSLESALLKQVQCVLKSVFDEEAVEDRMDSELGAELEKLIGKQSGLLGEQKVEFEEWIMQLIRAAVHGAQPHFEQLQNYAREVINDARSLCRSLNDKAMGIFQEHKDGLGELWYLIADNQ